MKSKSNLPDSLSLDDLAAVVGGIRYIPGVPFPRTPKRPKPRSPRGKRPT